MMTNHMMEVSRLTSKYGDPELENLDKRLSVPWPFFWLISLAIFENQVNLPGMGLLNRGLCPT